MDDFLTLAYPWMKALHVVAVIAWMAGLFYLPRLFVYHVEQVEKGSATDTMFLTMERRLLQTIMAPAAIASWLFGLGLVLTPGIVDWTAVWPWVKAFSVLAMSAFHHWLLLQYRQFASGTNRRTGRQFRIMNEVPTLLMISIVISVIVKF